MIKKTKRGGTSILEKAPFIKNINKKGIYIADDIDYNIRQGKKDELIKKYEDNLNEAKENVKWVKEEKARILADEDIQNKRDKITIEERKLRNNKIQFVLKIIGNILAFIINSVFKLLSLIGGGLKNFFNISAKVLPSIGKGFINLVGVGNGVIIKTLVLIIIIILAFFGYNWIVHNKDPSQTANDMVSTDKNYSSCLISTKTPNLFGDISNSLRNIIPDKYKFQFNFFKNKFNSIIGNDIYELVGIPREQITNGRNDGIYHIKMNNDNNNTYTTLKPNDINLPLSSISSITDIDFYKLPSNIQKIYPMNDNFVIPVENIDNTWKYNIEKIKYNDKIIKDINPFYELPFKNTPIPNEFKFNKIKAKISNNNDKSASTILSKMFNYNTDKYIYPF